MDLNSLIKAFSTLDLNSSDKPNVEFTAPVQDAPVKPSLIVRLPLSSGNAAAATLSLNDHALPPQASLLGLPQELRDQIYGYLAESEERIILGWRLVEVYKRHYPALSYDDCFTAAIALHPLSMTCKQMLMEFQPVLFGATKTRWTFSINNFDLEQFQFFNNYVNTGLAIKPSDEWLAVKAKDPTGRYDMQYNVQLRLRFQMDNNALISIARLRDLVLSSDPDDHQTMRAFRWAEWVPVTVGTLYHPRTRLSAKHLQSMTEGEAKRIDFSLRDLAFSEAWDEYWATAGGIPHRRDGWFDFCRVMQEFRAGFAKAIRETWAIPKPYPGAPGEYPLI